MNIFLDTNAIIYSFNQRINILDEIQRIVPGKKKIILLDCVNNELRQKAKRNYELIKKILDKMNVEIINVRSAGSVDNTLLCEASKNTNSIIITNDNELKQKALKKRIKVITVKQGKYFDFA